MSYEGLLVGILVIMVLVVLARAILLPKPTSRNVWRDDKGNVVAIGERQNAGAGRLSGHGSLLSSPLQLGTAEYRIDYQFEALTRVALVDASGDETLFIKNGKGTEQLSISASGAYRFLLEPTEENAAWSLEYRPLHPPPSPDEPSLP